MRKSFSAILGLVLGFSVWSCGGGGGGSGGPNGPAVNIVGHYEGLITKEVSCDKLKTFRMSVDITPSGDFYDAVIRLCDSQFCNLFSGFIHGVDYHLSLGTGFVGPSSGDPSFCSECAINPVNDCKGPKSGLAHNWEMDISPDGNTITGSYEGAGDTCRRSSPQSGEFTVIRRDASC